MIKKKRLEKFTDESVKKYKRAYKALERYDNGSNKKAELLADREGLQNYFQQL